MLIPHVLLIIKVHLIKNFAKNTNQLSVSIDTHLRMHTLIRTK